MSTPDDLDWGNVREPVAKLVSLLHELVDATREKCIYDIEKPAGLEANIDKLLDELDLWKELP